MLANLSASIDEGMQLIFLELIRKVSKTKIVPKGY